MRVLLLFLAFLLVFGAVAQAEQLPQAVLEQARTPLKPVGTGTFRKFGFTIYRVTLWSADGTWNKNKPYALQLRYARDLSKETLVENVADDLGSQHVADDKTVQNWRGVLEQVLTDVKEDDTIVSLCLPQQTYSPLFHNDNVILRTPDKAFIQAFFNIWLGETADKDLRQKLLGQS